MSIVIVVEIKYVHIDITFVVVTVNASLVVNFYLIKLMIERI